MEIEAAPNALSSKIGALEESDDTESLWNRFIPRDVPFFQMALLDQLLRRPYHAVTLEGPFNLKKLARDHRDRTFRSETSIDRRGNQKIDRLLLLLESGGFGYLDGDIFKIYAPTPEAAEAAGRQFRCYVKPEPTAKPFFCVISLQPDGPTTEMVAIERSAPVTTEELTLNYGEDFPTWEQQWTERMSRTPSGLTIFFGPPGCGKTSYLRALMARLIDKAVFYIIPVPQVDMLSNPRFVNFWLEQSKRHKIKRKVAILEDAEELLLPRDAGTRDKVSNLLNLADGFFGDHLKLHVVATTNAPIRQLDPALLRPGRLVGMREFRRLTRPEAQRLAGAKGLKLAVQSDYSLGELYCGAFNGSALNSGQQVGFAQSTGDSVMSHS